MPPTPRRTARVVLIDPADRFLLIRFLDPTDGRSWWAMPGGGLESGESYEQAAVREVHEETGLSGLDLGPCIWTRDHGGVFHGREFRVAERYFMARVPAFVPAPAALSAFERTILREMRWWARDELSASSDDFAPRRLPRLLDDLLDHGAPRTPVEVGA